MRLGVRVEFSGYGVDIEGGRTGGYGGSVGANVSIPVTNAVSFKPGLYFTYRAPVIMLGGNRYYTDTTDTELKVARESSTSTREFAIGVPLLMQASVTKGGGVFVETGVDMGIPFGTTQVTDNNCYNKSFCSADTDDEKDVDVYDMRTKFDVGFVAGLGFKVTERFAVDLRSVTYLNSLIRIARARFSQYSLGASVLFP